MTTRDTISDRGGSGETASTHRKDGKPPTVHWRFGRPYHHEPRRGGLIRLWKEKRGDLEPEEFGDNLVVQLGIVTEALNRSWYERNTGRAISDIQRWVQHPVRRFLAATIDGFVNELDAVFEAKFMLP